jgi:uncharacterized membrane protein YhaH (DUF805 family)
MAKDRGRLRRPPRTRAEPTGFRRLISSDGRANREEFWTISLLVTVFETIYIWMLDRYDHPHEDGFVRTLLIMSFSAAPFWPLLCVTGRRLHDANLSHYCVFVPAIGWRVAALIIALFGGSRDLATCAAGVIFLAFFAVVGVLKGTPGDNAYGPPPNAPN